jgi:hypothetical protein
MSQMTLAGARVVCKINSVLYARVTGFAWHALTPSHEIYGIDSEEAYELAPTTSKIVATMKMLRTSADGGAEGAGMAVGIGELSRERYFNVQLIDLATAAMLFQADRCRATEQSWDVPSRGKVTGILQFTALRWNNEVRSLGTPS